MTEFEWPPDEIAGPPSDESKQPGTRASAQVPSAPLAGVPVPVSGPQAGIPLNGPQPLADSAPPAARPTSLSEPGPGLPPPPPRQQPAIPLNNTPPIPVTPPSAPIPVRPLSSSMPSAPGAPPPPPAHQGRAAAQPPRVESEETGNDGQSPFPQRPTFVQPPAATGPQPATPTFTQPPVQPTFAQPPQQPTFAQPPQQPTFAQPSQQPTFAPQSQPTSPARPSGPPPSIPLAPQRDEVYLPTAEEFARRRATRPPDPVAHMGIQAAIRKSTFGLLNLNPGQREQELRRQTDLVRRNFGGLRQITIVNPKGGAGKTCAVLLLAMTFGRKRGGYVLAWDNNETQGTLGMRSQQDFHSRTVRDLLRDLHQFQGVNSRVGDLSQYVRAQGDGMFEVLASDESATAGEMLTADAFAEIREVVSRFYKLIMVDTGNNVRAENWQAAIDATDQLVVTMSARNDSAETAARMLDHLEQTGRQRLVRQAVTIVSLPPSRKELDIPAIERHFAARTRAVLIAPYERMLDSGEPIDYARLSNESQDAWLSIAAAVAEGL